MIRFWLFLPVISLSKEQSSSLSDDRHSVDKDALFTRALLGPPSGSAYDKYKNLCGIANPCETPDAVGCELGEKRRKRDSPQGEDYIKQGESVPKFKYPWMAILAIKEESGFLFWKEVTRYSVCTGSLVSMRHVLTARHCLTMSWSSYTGLSKQDWDVRKAPKTDKFFVLLGADRVKEGIDGDPTGPFTFEVESKVLDMMIPPQTKDEHDFAMLRIEDVSFTDKIRPICLPIDGIPLGGHYIQAGFGLKGAYYDDTGARRQNHPDALQEVNDVYMDFDTVNPKNEYKWPYLDEADVLEPTDGTFPHNGTGVKTMFVIHSSDGREPCSGDSGGPLMWRNPNTGVHFIVGVHYGKVSFTLFCEPNSTEIIRMLGTKVTYFMEYIYQQMRPIAYANKLCLPEECKKNSNTTWIRSDHRLAAPCGTLNDEDGLLCIKRGRDRVLTDRKAAHSSKEDYLDNGYTECVPCPRGSPINWNYEYWLEQITLGSFSRPRYFGVQSPFKMLKTYFGGILQDQPDDGCVDYEHVGVQCIPHRGKGTCISSADLCDGHDDCPGAWDENPSLCLGKCDYWKQHEDSESHWPCNECTKTKNLTATECHKSCGSSCKWYQREENGDCLHFFSERFSGEEFKNRQRAVRGPGKCPEIAAAGIVVCKNILTPPYRSGAFRIQTFSGRFLQLNIGRKHNLNLVGLGRADLMDPVPEGEANNVNATEWIFQFHGARQLADSYSTIRTGIFYNNPSLGLHAEPIYITVRYPDHSDHVGPDVDPNNRNYIGPDGGYVFMHRKLNDDFHDPANNLTQRIYIRPTYDVPRDLKPRDLMDLAIFTKYKDPASNTLKIVRFFSERGDFEYNHGGRSGNELPNNLKLYAAGPAHTQDGLFLKQREGRFRLLECDYILPERKGVKPLPDKYKKPNNYLQKCLQSHFTRQGLNHDLGISYNRWKKVELLGKVRHFKERICEALKDSHTIWDYAGRMRLTTEDFRRMYYHFEHFDNTSTAGTKKVLKEMKDYFLENIPEYY